MTGITTDLRGRTAVVTGATRGIGRAIAEALLENGADVIGLQRSSEGGPEGSFRAVAVDLADGEATRAAASRIAAEQRVDILINNAGINIRHPFEDFPLADFDRVMQVNVARLVELTQVFGRPMLERGDGAIVNIASMLSFFGGFTASAYGASKGAVAQFTKSVANEWAGRGVTVNAVAPGFIATDLNAALIADETRNRQILERIPAGRWGRPEDVAGAVLFLVSPAARYMQGTVVPVDGGYLSR